MHEEVDINPVECHSGFTYADRPSALTWEGKKLPIQGIVKEWRSPNRKCFRVRTMDERIFELVYDEMSDVWQVCLI
jgi:hypothetical protein